MYKLVVVAGKLRGKEFILEEGDNTLGRDPNCSIPIKVQGVSKKHVSITVAKDAIYIKDLGSSNGTFLNGKIINRGTAKNGDKITLPDTIMQVVFVKEKKVIIKKKAAAEEEEEEEDSYMSPGDPPKSLPAKIVWMFKYKYMPFLHGINEEYEWRVLLGILLAIFCVVIISLTIFPVLRTSRNILLKETALRGAHYAEEIGRLNARALETNNLDRINATFLDREEGVVFYDLFDLKGRIVAPTERLNEYIADTLSVRVWEWAEKQKSSDGSKVYSTYLGSGNIGIGKRIMAYNSKAGSFEAVGIIAIRFAPKSLVSEASDSRLAYFKALIISFSVAHNFLPGLCPRCLQTHHKVQ